LHNKPQGLVNWCRKTHEKINAILISRSGQLRFVTIFTVGSEYKQLSDISNNLWFKVFLKWLN
jgi:hypothetical protein